MTIPTNDAVTKALRHFTDELRGVVKLHSRSHPEDASIEQILAVARAAEESADRTSTEVRTPANADAAQMLSDFAAQVSEIAEASTDQMHAASLKIAATALRTFVLRHTPFATTAGLRFAD
jgi:acetylornithine deacetylase/succinyl-diaminopimelate desuccinylase-like protein